MLRRLYLTLAVTAPLALSAPLPGTAAAENGSPPASRWIPRDAFVVIELSRAQDVLDLALSPKMVASVTSQPAYRQLTSQPGFFQFQALISFIEGKLGTDWKTGLRRLLAGGVTLAAGPHGSTVLIVEAADGRILEDVHEVFLGIARGEAAKRGRPEDVASREVRGVTTWTFGKEEAHAIVGNRLLVTNRTKALEAMLDLRARSDDVGSDDRSLASQPAYRAARRAAGTKATAAVFLNMAALKQHGALQRALIQKQNPLVALLFASVTESLRTSSWLSLGLRVKGETLTVEALLDGKASGDSGVAAFACAAAPDQGALPNLSVPRRIAGISFYRDLHGFYAAKDELFPERTSGLIFFENMMGIFFSGMDLTDEVLAEIEPEVRFVVASQDYDPAVGTPRVQIPAFAAILRMRHPQAFAEIVEEAWQKAIGLVNFTRGQQAMPGLIIDRPTRSGTRYTAAYFRAPKEKQDIDSRYNFRPALARTGDILILSSTDGLAGDLIDALSETSAPRAEPLKDIDSLLEIDGPELAAILAANRENFVRQNMVEKGNTREQAEAEISIFSILTDYLDRVELGLGRHRGQPRLKLKLQLNLECERR